jgi:hypothetical protein
VCGQVTSLSPFVVAAGPAPTTTTTTTHDPTPTTTTTLPEKLAGKKLLLKDKAGKAAEERPHVPGQRHHARRRQLERRRPGGEGRHPFYRAVNSMAAYELPASGWKYQGKAGQNKGYKFKGTRSIKSVIVKKGKLLSIVGKGEGLGQNLSTDPKPVKLTLQLGAASTASSSAAPSSTRPKRSSSRKARRLQRNARRAARSWSDLSRAPSRCAGFAAVASMTRRPRAF